VGIAIFVASLSAFCQTFEAASIKPATPLGPMGMRVDRHGGPGTPDPGTYRCQNCPLSWVLTEAYHVQDFEYSAPDWVNSVRFDFAAKLPQSGATREEFRKMLQNLLVERFKLVVHREKKDAQVYELTVGKGGPRFHESTPGQADSEEASGPPKRDADGFPILTGSMTMAVVGGHARLRSEDRDMAWFTEMLSGQLRAPVIDATGLTGKYDFIVSWALGEKSEPPQDPASALIDAIQSQLGLKLERKKGQIEMLVVDRMEKKPTDN
jgi:uncharacterized protein (TIGR03435 family)